MSSSRIGRIFGKYLSYKKIVLSDRIIFERKTLKARKVKSLEIIMTLTPHVQSRASYILLRDFYLKKDERYQKCRHWRIWKRVKNNIIRENKEKNNGVIRCHYCNKILDPMSNHKKDKITMDHIVPLNKGGDYFNESNLVVSCAICNVIKGNSILDEEE